MKDLADVCRKRRYNGPTPCEWPDCICIEKSLFPELRPFLAYLRNWLMAVSLVLGLCALSLFSGSTK